MEWENLFQVFEVFVVCNYYVICDVGMVNLLLGFCYDQFFYVVGVFLENCYIYSKIVIICSKFLLLYNVRDFENVWNL